MSRRYRSESIEVAQDRHGEPAGFRWRGRRYVVSSVVATWVEALPWWAGRTRSAGRAGEVRPVDRASGQPSVPERSGQRQVWRVEAAQRGGARGVYDLSRLPSGWELDRVID